MENNIVFSRDVYVCSRKSEDAFHIYVAEQLSYLKGNLKKQFLPLILLILFTLFYFILYGAGLSTNIPKFLASIALFSGFYVFSAVSIYRWAKRLREFERDPEMHFRESGILIWETGEYYYLANLDAVPNPFLNLDWERVSKRFNAGITRELIETSAFYKHMTARLSKYKHPITGDAHLANIYNFALIDIITMESQLGNREFFKK